MSSARQNPESPFSGGWEMKCALFLAGVLCASAGHVKADSTNPADHSISVHGISLAEAIRLARKNSPVLNGAIADVEAAKAGARAAQAGLMPKLSANGFAASGNNSSILGSTPMVDPPAWMLVPTGSFLDGNLSLMVPFFAPRLQAMAGSATWQARAAFGDLAEASAELDLQVTEDYDRVLLVRQLILAERAKVSAAQELVRTAQAMLDAGKGIEASVQRGNAELSRAQRDLATAQNDEAKDLLELEAAMGSDMSSPLDPKDELTDKAPATGLQEILVKAKMARGILVAARARREAANKDIGAAVGQRSPQLYGAVMGDATNRSDMGGLSAGLTLSIPLFDGGRISAEISQAKFMKAKADALLKQAELAVEKEVRQAWLDMQSAASNASSARASVSAAQVAYDVTALRVSAGKSILLEQLDALEALVHAKSDLAQSTFDQAVAIARLNRATGGQL